MKLALAFAGSIFLFFMSNSALAHELPPEVQDIVDEVRAMEGNVEAGRSISKQHCMACHGVKGVPMNSRNSNTPYVADQTPTYIAIQLAAFKTDNRHYPTMNYLAKRLSSRQMADLIAFYTSVDARDAHCFDESSVIGDAEAGEELARRERPFRRADGSVVKVSCTMCHGQEGVMPDAVRTETLHPDLAGLGRTYVLKALTDFRESRRDGGPMTLMTRDLSDQDLANLAAYYSRINRCK